MYHEGERKIQELTEEVNIADANGRVINNSIVLGAIKFIENQSMVIISSVDSQQNVWISIVTGNNGFIEVEEHNKLSIDLNRVTSSKLDILFKNLIENNSVGTLFIELASRRRYRINGDISITDDKIRLTVVEAYPNCPKYIQQRKIVSPTATETLGSKQKMGSILSEQLKDWISSSDTLFVGSQSSHGLMDASHRGGNPGFVQIPDEHIIKIPDYSGNSLYNTLGNFVQNANAGLLFIDFVENKTLQLTGKASILFDQNSEKDMELTGGTGRYWIFKISSWIITHNHNNTNWEFNSFSPFNP
ncbi:pyridoxamine 5'-phosphate oxidase family protein [Flaviramulus aquimarinus]|uniref:Pyridoxamine 5'-phosphate oxidase family protein n=1 Tax=Flaviramulus aquimarinus TaxID=1170456 RepID=A0ABP9ETZ4_9FLAO